MNSTKTNQIRPFGNFQQIKNQIQNKIFGFGNKNFENLKSTCDRSFIEQKILLGQKDGIIISELDRPEIYTQSF